MNALPDTPLHAAGPSRAEQDELRELLPRLLAPLVRLAGAQAGAVRVASADGQRLLPAGAIGVPGGLACTNEAVESGCGVCGSALGAAKIAEGTGDMAHCARRNAGIYFGQACHRALAVPLAHRGHVFGVCNLFFADEAPTGEDLSTLLAGAGEVLGLALHHACFERSSLQTALLAERQAMVAEVHDSVGQTLTFAKMRMPLLEQALAAHDEAAATRYCGDVRQAVGSAHVNLRQVLAHLRAPLEPIGLDRTLTACALPLRQLGHTELIVDNRAPGLALSAVQEFQVSRIVQEALANVTRHANARHAWLTVEQTGGRVQVRIEDDGVGLPAPGSGGDGETHFGLEIMRLRAAGLGGTLQVGARPAGGTAISLEFDLLLE